MTTAGNSHFPAFRRMMVFVDGENLVARFQEMVKERAWDTSGLERGSLYLKDTFVWIPRTVEVTGHEILRTTYYTSAQGDEVRVTEVADKIKALRIASQPHRSGLPSGILPYVVKRKPNQRQSKGVDIKMCVDILTQTHYGNLDTVFLVTGDGDFLPLIKEVVHSGKQVFLGALSSGLNVGLLNYVDRFIDLDPVYFPPKPA